MLIVFLILPFTFISQVEAVRFNVTNDSYVAGYDPLKDNNYGTNPEIHVESPNGWYEKRGYLNYSTFNITDENTFNSAYLYLYLSFNNWNVYYSNAYSINGSWNETDITWNNQPLLDDDIICSTNTTIPNFNGWVRCGITSLVKSWSNNTHGMYGIVMRPPTSGSNYHYSSREGSYPSYIFLNTYLPTIPEISSPVNASRHYNNSINFTWNTSTDADNDNLTYDFWLSEQSNFSSTVNRTNFSNNWTGDITTVDGTTYYSRVRAYDSYDYSNWSNISQFTENTVPVVVNITLSPSSPSITSNLTISMNGTDAEGDPLTNHYLWYKNSVLQSWNGTFVNYSGNYTTGDAIYVSGYTNDGYENSTQLQSNIVNIGSNNSAPTFTTLTLIPSTAKYNQTIHINASGITDDSSTWQLQTYYKSGGNVYIANSTFVNTSFINITATVPFSTAGAHMIYAVVYDSGNVTGEYNLTSAEAYATFTTDLTNPTLESSSLSATAITVGTSVTISARFNGQGANISSALVKVERPDATSANWTMTCNSGEVVNCTKVYTATSDVGEYDVTFFYPSDTASITSAISSSLSFTASNPSGGGGGGGSTTVIVNPTQTPLTSRLNLSISNITEGARSLSEVAAISECLSQNFFLSNECTGAVVVAMKEQVNWASLLVGALFGAFGTVYISNLLQPKKRSIVLDSLIYTLITILMLLSMNLIGFNFTYLLNYLLNSSLPAWLFLSSMMWAFLVSIIVDNTIFKQPIVYKTRKFNI